MREDVENKQKNLAGPALSVIDGGFESEDSAACLENQRRETKKRLTNATA